MITLHGEFRGIRTEINSGTIVRDLSVPVRVQIYNAGIYALKLSSVFETILEPGESSGDMIINAGETLHWSGITKFQWKIFFNDSKAIFGKKDKDTITSNSDSFINNVKTTTLIWIKNLGSDEPIKLIGKYSEQIEPNKELTLLLEKGSSLSWESKSYGEFLIAEVGQVMENSHSEVNLKPK